MGLPEMTFLLSPLIVTAKLRIRFVSEQLRTRRQGSYQDVETLAPWLEANLASTKTDLEKGNDVLMVTVD